ncbi:hypothetical protein BU17DRAFT_43596 [Hysterangium stoloniferum]|nr:hypothetical protein BU17DRAFT_43596 [Hysterangium stoloniferum]
MLRAIIPSPGEQVPIHWHNLPLMFVPSLGLYYIGYLARKKNTCLLRAAVAPLIIFGSFHVAFGYVWLDPRYGIYNFLKANYCLAVIAVSIDLAFRTEVIQKVTEQKRGGDNGHSPNAPQLSSPSKQKELAVTGLISDIREGMYICHAARGLEYDWGQDVTVPRETRRLERKPFLLATLRQLLHGLLVVDFIDSLWKLIPALQNPMGGSIFVSSLPWPMRYTLSTVLHYSTATMLQYMLQTSYDLMTIFGVLILRQSPKVWPPIIEHPFLRDSLIDFWSTGWHQLLRQVFFIFGGFPGRWLSQKLGFGGGIGLLFGTFFASAMFHEIPFYFLGSGFDWRAPAFFMQQACFVFMERVFRRVTGRRVSGLLGVIWANFAMGILSQNMSDSWHQRGFGSSAIVPESISPTRRVILPLVSYVLDS